jgi:hypothetical protein
MRCIISIKIEHANITQNHQIYDDDVYLNKLQTKGVIYSLHIKRRPANEA